MLRSYIGEFSIVGYKHQGMPIVTRKCVGGDNIINYAITSVPLLFVWSDEEGWVLFPICLICIYYFLTIFLPLKNPSRTFLFLLILFLILMSARLNSCHVTTIPFDIHLQQVQLQIT